MSTMDKLREFYEYGKCYLGERRRRRAAEKGRQQIVSAPDAEDSEDELTPTSASSFDAEQEVQNNPLTGKQALWKYFGFLGASRFRDAAQLCRVHHKAINGTLPSNAWQGGKGEPFHKSLLSLVVGSHIQRHVPSTNVAILSDWDEQKAERVLGSFQFTKNKSLSQLHSMFVALVRDFESASATLSRANDQVEIRGTSVPLEGSPEQAGNRDWLVQAARWIDALVTLLQSRVALVGVLQTLQHEEGLANPPPLLAALAPFACVPGEDGARSPNANAEGEESDWFAVLAPLKDRAGHETNILAGLLRVQECCLQYDFLGMSLSMFGVHKRLMKLANAIELAGGGVEGGTTVISEWWTQMDGYWGGNTTRALQQYINAKFNARTADPEEGVDVSVDGNFGPKTISALQRYLNREREAFTLTKDISMRGNAPKPGSGSANALAILQTWPELPVNGTWSQATKTALQAFLRQKVPSSSSFSVDGRFHKHSSQALQMFLAKEGWYRPALHNLANVHQSRVTMHSVALHRWLCALQEGLESNAGFVFHSVIAEKERSRAGYKDKDMLNVSQRTALPYFHVVDSFAQKHSPRHVLLVLDTAQNPSFSLKGYAPPTSAGRAGGCAAGAGGGLGHLPAVFSHPPMEEEARQRHWPTVATLVMEGRQLLHAHGRDSMQCHFEPKLNCTYFVHQVDHRAAFVVLFEGKKKKEGNGATLRFVNFIIEGMCCRNVVCMLKPA